MASDLIRLDKQGMEGVISQTKMAKENYDMAIQSLKRIIEGLNDVWVGEAQRGMYERTARKLLRLSPMRLGSILMRCRKLWRNFRAKTVKMRR